MYVICLNPENGIKYEVYQENEKEFWLALTVNATYSVFSTTNTTEKIVNKLASQLLTTVPLVRRNGFVWFMNHDNYQLLLEQQPHRHYPLELEGYPLYITCGI